MTHFENCRKSGQSGGYCRMICSANTTENSYCVCQPNKQDNSKGVERVELQGNLTHGFQEIL